MSPFLLQKQQKQQADLRESNINEVNIPFREGFTFSS